MTKCTVCGYMIDRPFGCYGHDELESKETEVGLEAPIQNTQNASIKKFGAFDLRRGQGFISIPLNLTPFLNYSFGEKYHGEDLPDYDEKTVLEIHRLPTIHRIMPSDTRPYIIVTTDDQDDIWDGDFYWTIVQADALIAVGML